MGDDDHGDAFVGQGFDNLQHFIHFFRIQRRGGLIEQHDLRTHHQGAGDRHPLLLSAGELVRILPGVLQHAHFVQQFAGVLAELRVTCQMVIARGQQQIAEHGQMREQVKALEHHADVQAMFGILHKARLLLPLAVEVNKGLAVNLNFAVIDLLKTVQQANEGGFPRA